MLFGEILIAAGAANREVIARAVQHATATQQRLGSALIDLGLVNSDIVASALAKQYSVQPARDANFLSIPAEFIDILSSADAMKHCAIPLGFVRETNQLAIAVVDPGDTAIMEALRSATGKQICVAVASECRIREALTKYYGDDPDIADLNLELGPMIALGPSLDLSLASPPNAAFAARTGVSSVMRAAPAVGTSSAPARGPGKFDLAPAAEISRRFEIGDILDTMAANALATTAAFIVLVVVGLRVSGVWVGGCGYEVTYNIPGVLGDNHKNELLSLRLDFPDTGWEVQSTSMQGRNGVGATTYARGAEEVDILVLMISYADAFVEGDEAQLDQLIATMAANEHLTSGSLGFEARAIVCRRTYILPVPAAECVGQGTLDGGEAIWSIKGYFWVEDDALIFPMFGTLLDEEGLAADISAIVPTIKKLD